MDAEETDYRLEIFPSAKTNAKIALMCGALGVVVSTTAYLFINGVATKTIDNVNILLREQFTMELKDRD
jgi:hypothetical protein